MAIILKTKTHSSDKFQIKQYLDLLMRLPVCLKLSASVKVPCTLIQDWLIFQLQVHFISVNISKRFWSFVFHCFVWNISEPACAYLQKYIQTRHGYELIYLVCIWKKYRSAQTYAHNTTECISYMHSAYDIWTLVRCYMRTYLHVSWFPMLCILCICVCMSDTFNPHTSRYILIWTLKGSSYLHVSACIFVRNTCTYALLYPVRICMHLPVFGSWIQAGIYFWPYMRIYTHATSEYLYVSVCILCLDTWTYAIAFVNQICVFYCAE